MKKLLLLAAATIAAASVAVPSPAAAATTCSSQFGMYETGAPWSWNKITQLDNQIGRHSEIVQWYAEWGDRDASAEFSNNKSLLDATRKYSSAGKSGSTPMITWEPWGEPHQASINAFPLTDIASGKFDAYIDSWAQGLHADGKQVLLRFAHEMDENNYPWGAGINGNTPAGYIAAFRHVHDRFSRAGADNVKFVWSPDANDGSGSWPAMSNFYPGDSYVDWIGIDLYNSGTTESWSSWKSFDDLFHLSYADAQALSSQKPIMLAEWASAEQGGDKGQWIKDAATTLASRYPQVKATVWFSESGTQWAFDSSPGALAGAKAAFGSCTPGSSGITPVAPGGSTNQNTQQTIKQTNSTGPSGGNNNGGTQNKLNKKSSIGDKTGAEGMPKDPGKAPYTTNAVEVAGEGTTDTYESGSENRKGSRRDSGTHSALDWLLAYGLKPDSSPDELLRWVLQLVGLD